MNFKFNVQSLKLKSHNNNYLPSSRLYLSRKLLLTTDTELIAMEAPAIIGLSKNPKKG